MNVANGDRTWTAPEPPTRSRGADYLVLTKIRMNVLVLFSTFVGAFLATVGPIPWALVLHAMAGTFLTSIGSSSLNQFLEREVDARMHRTRERPLPTGRLRPAEALAVGAGCCIGGVVYLAIFTNVLTAFLAALTIVSYVFAYTPLKQKSLLSTIVGAVPGALPALGGWTAIRGNLQFEAWILFGIVFFWQLPHFMAIAWRHREDYARGGIRVLPVLDLTGQPTGQQVIFHTMALLPITLLPTVVGLTGPVYFAGACVCGAAFLGVAVAFVVGNRDAWARPLFHASIAYLTILFSLMLLDKGGLV